MEGPGAERPPQADAPAFQPAATAGATALVFTEPVMEPQSAPSTFETERVREVPQRDAKFVAEAPSSAGYAPVAPVKIEWPADLQQIESDPDKVRGVQQQVIEDRPSASRAKRVRQPLEPVSDEPLVQIETDKAGTTDRDEKATVLPG